MTSPIDLASLADCKAWLGLSSTGDDMVLSGLITSLSQAILADLSRAVLPGSYSETLDGGGETSLPLRDWPVTSVLSCSLDGVQFVASTRPGQHGFVLDTPAAAPPGCMQRLALRGGSYPRGTQNVAVTYRAGYEIMGETAVVPSVAPYVVVALAPFGAWASDAGVSGAADGYTVASGTYTFAASDAGASLALSYGYVPADLARATIEWVADRYVARSRIGQAAKTLGGQETMSFIVKAMPDVVSRLLQPYRRVAR